jgi:hypothetical protein
MGGVNMAKFIFVTFKEMDRKKLFIRQNWQYFDKSLIKEGQGDKILGKRERCKTKYVLCC